MIGMIPAFKLEMVRILGDRLLASYLVLCIAPGLAIPQFCYAAGEQPGDAPRSAQSPQPDRTSYLRAEVQAIEQSFPSRPYVALQKLDELLSAKSNPPLSPAFRNQLLALRARALNLSNRTREAKDLLDALILLEPNNADFKAIRADTLLLRQKYPEALISIDSAIRLNPKNPNMRVIKAEILHKQGDELGAQRELQVAKQFCTAEDASIWVRIAIYYWNLGDIANVEDTVARGLKAKNPDPYFYRMLGDIEARRKNTDKAVKAYTIFAGSGEPPHHFVEAGMSLQSAGLEDKAREMFDKAVNMSPDDAFCRYTRGTFLTAIGDQEGAIADFTKAAELSPEDAAIYAERAQAHARLNRDREAITDAEKALSLDPYNWVAKLVRARAEYNLGHHTKTIELCTKMIKASPSFAETYMIRARCYASLGNWWEAVQDYTTGMTAGGDVNAFLVYRAEAYISLRRLTSALEDVNNVLRSQPHNVGALEMRSKIFKLMGRPELSAADAKLRLDIIQQR